MADLKTSIIISAVDKLTVPVKKITASYGRMTNAIRRAERPARVLNERQRDARGRFIKAADAADRQARSLRGLAAAAGVAGRFLKKIATLRALGILAGAVYGFKRTFVDTAASFERFQTVLETIEGSSEKARQSMDWISDFAVKTPFEMEQVTDAFVKLRSDGMDPTGGLLRTLGDAAAATGKPLTRAVEAMTGAVSGDNEGLAEFDIEARAAEGGKIRYEYEVGGETRIAEAMAADGAQIRQVLGGILDAKFGGSMAEESKTFMGMLGNLTEQWARFQNLVMASGLFDFLKGRLGALLDTLDRMAADGSLQRIAEQVGTRAVAAFRAAEEAIEQPACLSHHAARRSVREGRQDEARAAWRAQACLTVRRARQASATKSWRSYRVLRPSGDEKVRLGPWVERIGEALSWAAGKLGDLLPSEQRGMEAGGLLEWRRMAMVCVAVKGPR